MTFLPSLLPWQWAFLAAVPLGIVLLYFLKLRRQSVRVPSTLLWSKAIEDLHVNSLLQRLRRNLLLLLQLLAVLLTALALLRPGVRGEASTTGRKILLLDSSASMQATDVAPEGHRFAQAKRMIGEEIEALRDSDVAMLVAFSDRADVLQSFTSDRRRLREALERATVTSRPADISEALRAAEGLANPTRPGQAGQGDAGQGAEARPAELLLYSDGGFGSIDDFDLGNLQPRYIKVGGDAAENLAILAFSVERHPERPGQVQAFATVANLGAAAAAATATLTLDGTFIDADQVMLEPGEETGVTFSLEVDEAERLELTLDVEDDFALDNVAHTGISPLRLVSVLLVSDGNEPLELALTTGQAVSMCDVEIVSPEYLQSDAYRARSRGGRDDLVIYDRCRPEEMPLSNTFFVGTVPPRDWQRGETSSPLLLVDIDRSHPIMRYLELFSLLIAEGNVLQPPAGAVELLAAEAGTILALAPRDGYQDLVLGFEILSSDRDGEAVFNTDWHVQRSWPVFVLNLLRYLAGAAHEATLASYRPGQTVSIRTENRLAQVEIRGPGGLRTEASPAAGGAVLFSRTDEIGFYELRDESGRTVDRFAVNLFDRRESQIAAAESVSLGYESVPADAAVRPRRREYWRLLLLCVLGVITLEWCLYTRRLG